MYYNKYLKYKKKYLQLKNQLGGIPFCEKAYRNLLGTCWMVAILTMFTFGQATSDHLKRVIEGIREKNFDGFVRYRIGELQGNPQLMNFYPGILDDGNLIFFENIMNNFIRRYDSKISSHDKKPENLEYDLANPKRCELVIAQNFKNLFNHPIFSYSLELSNYGGILIERYLFANLLSVFFLGEKVSFKNYYHDFQSINFNPVNDLGILMHVKDHVCCLYICDGSEKYYDDNNKQVYNCLWQNILKRSTNLFIKKDSNFDHIESYENTENLQLVLYLTVISKQTTYSALDQEIENILKKDFSSINDRELQAILGTVYDKGLGVPEDKVEAERFFRIAAMKGNVNAQYNLGNIFFYGEGVTINYDEAMRWWRIAADQGHARAQNNLGSMFQQSDGVGRDYFEAARLYRLAAVQEDAIAQNNLGFMLENGFGVAQDMTEAMQWYRKSADQGYAEAQLNLGFILSNNKGVAQDMREAVRLYRLAADQGHTIAQFNLGLMFVKGEGVAEDKTEAVRLFRLAAAQGHTDAQKVLKILTKQ